MKRDLVKHQQSSKEKLEFLKKQFLEHKRMWETVS